MIRRPTYGQREYYNGYKKAHTVDVMFIHDGDGLVRYIRGPQPGSRNDVDIAKTSDICIHPEKYLTPGHNILGDLAFHWIGYPFLCRIAYQEHYTIQEMNYNKYHSKCRVISENFYGRLKSYFPIFGKLTETSRFH